MLGLVINKMSFKTKEGDLREGVNLTLKGDHGYFIDKSYNSKGESKLKFYSMPHEIFTSVKVGQVYNFTFKTDSDTGARLINGCKLSSFEET